jgi:hypothetical protein
VRSSKVSEVETPFPGTDAVDHGVERGIQWVTCQAPLYGAVNGYVKIPTDHHWHGLSYDEINVTVHGGLTYGGRESGWIGFDTIHSGDIWPDSGYQLPLTKWDKHWTAELVAEETRSLARKVAAAAYTSAELSGSCAAFGDAE